MGSPMTVARMIVGIFKRLVTKESPPILTQFSTVFTIIFSGF